jgi:hypothetical protein
MRLERRNAVGTKFGDGPGARSSRRDSAFEKAAASFERLDLPAHADNFSAYSSAAARPGIKGACSRPQGHAPPHMRGLVLAPPHRPHATRHTTHSLLLGTLS